jgi:drug/metabolite transporter (DMT)-like permease
LTQWSGAANGLGLAAALSWGAGDFCGGLATRKASPYQVVFVAHGLSLVLVFLAAMASHRPLPSIHAVLLGLLAGLAGGLGLMAFYLALSLGKMGLTASLAGVLNTAIPVLFSLFVFGSPTPLQMVGFAIAVIAISLIAYVPGGETRPRGMVLATAAGVGFGLLLILLNRAGQESILWALTFSRVSSTAVALALLLIQSRRRQSALTFPTAPWNKVLPLAALAGLLDTGGNFLYTAASVAGRLDVAAVISSLYPAVTILLAIWLLRERATRLQAAGMALALAAVALISA